jgi:heme exporter protein A
MTAITLEVSNLRKEFGNRKVIKGLSFSISAPGSLGITGHNGSGKSTLMKLIAGLESPTKGKIILKNGEAEVSREDSIAYLKMVAPEMALYEMLSGYENLQFFARLADVEWSRAKADHLLERVGLSGRGDDLVGGYSSGMKQRLKYAVALLPEPHVLLLDEPTSNLDETGKAIVRAVMADQQKENILIVATNEAEDLESVEQVIRLDG